MNISTLDPRSVSHVTLDPRSVCHVTLDPRSVCHVTLDPRSVCHVICTDSILIYKTTSLSLQPLLRCSLKRVMYITDK